MFSVIPDYCHACGACTGRISDRLRSINHTRSHVARPPPKFYFLEFASTTEVIEGLGAGLRGKAPDETLPVATAQHLADLPLLKALNTSAQRTFRKSDAEVRAHGRSSASAHTTCCLGLISPCS